MAETKEFKCEKCVKEFPCILIDTDWDEDSKPCKCPYGDEKPKWVEVKDENEIILDKLKAKIRKWNSNTRSEYICPVCENCYLHKSEDITLKKNQYYCIFCENLISVAEKIPKSKPADIISDRKLDILTKREEGIYQFSKEKYGDNFKEAIMVKDTMIQYDKFMSLLEMNRLLLNLSNQLDWYDKLKSAMGNKLKGFLYCPFQATAVICGDWCKLYKGKDHNGEFQCGMAVKK